MTVAEDLDKLVLSGFLGAGVGNYHHYGFGALFLRAAFALCQLAPPCLGVGLLARRGATSRQELFSRFNAGSLLFCFYSGTSRRRLEVGSPKVALLPALGTTRTLLDASVHVLTLALLALVLCRHSTRRSSRALAACLAYISLFDAIYVANWLISPMVLMALWGCLAESLAGRQLVMLLLMSGTGFGKLGPHADMHGTAGFAALVGMTLSPAWGKLFWSQGELEARPSALAGFFGVWLVWMEILVPWLLLLRPAAVVKAALVLLCMMHGVIALVVMGVESLLFLQVWCVAGWLCLFDGKGFDRAGFRAMPAAAKVGALLFVALNLCATLTPQLYWHPLIRYTHFGSGNQPCCHPVLVSKAAAEKMRWVQPGAWVQGEEMAMLMLKHRWTGELNHRGSAALLDYALERCGRTREEYYLVMYSNLEVEITGATSDTMSNHGVLLFREWTRMEALDECDVMLPWLGSVSWQFLPFMKRQSRWDIWDGRGGLMKSWEIASEELRSVRRPSDAARLLVGNESTGASEPSSRQEL